MSCLCEEVLTPENVKHVSVFNYHVDDDDYGSAVIYTVNFTLALMMTYTK